MNKLFMTGCVALFTSTLLLFSYSPRQSIATNNAHDICVIFDLNGVVLHTQGTTKLLFTVKENAADNSLKNILSPLTLAKLAWRNSLNPFKLQHILRAKLFNLLNTLEPRSSREFLATDEYGQPLPQLMCNWLKGKNKDETILKLIDAELEKEMYDQDRDFLRATCKLIFTPELFAQTQYVVDDTIKFIKELKAQNITVCLLSNLSSESGTLLVQKFPELFQLFDHIIFSGDTGLIKPDPAIFEYALKKCGCQAHNSFFIDDQITNIATAFCQCNIASALAEKKNGLLSSAVSIDNAKEKFYNWLETKQQAVPERIAA